MKRSIAIASLIISSTTAFAPYPSSSCSSSALSMARRGKGLSGVSGSNKLSKPKTMEGSESSAPTSNWAQTSIPSIKSLPKEKNQVQESPR